MYSSFWNIIQSILFCDCLWCNFDICFRWVFQANRAEDSSHDQQIIQYTIWSNNLLKCLFGSWREKHCSFAYKRTCLFAFSVCFFNYHQTLRHFQHDYLFSLWAVIYHTAFLFVITDIVWVQNGKHTLLLCICISYFCFHLDQRYLCFHHWNYLRKT